MKTTLALLATGCAVLAISACSKSSSDSSSSARILFANGSVGTTSASLTVNNTTLSNASSVAYLSFTGYESAAAGTATLSASLTGVGPLGTISTSIIANASYSVFDCGSVLADTLILIADDLPSTSNSYAYVRLVNTSSDTTAAAITASVGNTSIGSNIAYAAASGFTQVTPGSYTLTAFNVNKPANIATLSNTQLNGGKIYTLMYSGNSTQTVGFRLTIMPNN
jgi:Domain of unknown function (DUF4397)